jgi:hypothetical protein
MSGPKYAHQAVAGEDIGKSQSLIYISGDNIKCYCRHIKEFSIRRLMALAKVRPPPALAGPESNASPRTKKPSPETKAGEDRRHRQAKPAGIYWLIPW